ncbi:lipopolysaccharide assembly protein LapA domain-containing protein [Luteimonas saliphila]|uniref:lipopolysaccharide assembly protein LapA domain-containing protein n=1 Tax=Luteimonas saliphila TaxID=2804919 RepID=UPI00192D9004|nr:lipopolysaccharide assembly protein LapA domain-containing protein [Luteimonas saliphila]
MRLLRILIALLFALLGIAVGALNPQRVTLDLGFAGLDAGLGVMLLAALLAGAVCGGLALALGVIVPLRRRLQRDRAGEDPARPPYDTGV